MSIISGFMDCAECGGEHLPISGKCTWKIKKGAAVHLSASGACLSLDMIGRVLRELDAKRGKRGEPHRYVSAFSQRVAYLRSGGTLQNEIADDGAGWITNVEYPLDALLIEAPDMYGVITDLNVQGLPQSELILK